MGRPVGSFLLTGPTGVGKTELARQLAQVLGIGFLRFDMSEYMESMQSLVSSVRLPVTWDLIRAAC